MSDASIAAADRAPTSTEAPTDLRGIANTLDDTMFDVPEDEGGSEEDRREEDEGTTRGREEPNGSGDQDPETETDEARQAREEEEDREARRSRGEETDEERQDRETREAEGGDKPKAEDKPEATHVRIRGEDIPVAEIERGFMRQADYTRKTQELAQGRQYVEQEVARVRAQEQELSGVLDLAVAITKNALPAPPDRALLDHDPVAFIRAKDHYDSEFGKLQQLVQAQQAAARQQSEQTTAQTRAEQERRAQTAQEALQTEIKATLEKLPELRTPEGRNTFFNEAGKHGAAYGFAPEEIGGIQDHRMLLVLKDAMAYRRLQSAKPAAEAKARAAQPIRTAPRAPGTRDADGRRAAEDRFRREPTLRNAAESLPDDLF